MDVTHFLVKKGPDLGAMCLFCHQRGQGVDGNRRWVCRSNRDLLKRSPPKEAPLDMGLSNRKSSGMSSHPSKFLHAVSSARDTISPRIKEVIRHCVSASVGSPSQAGSNAGNNVSSAAMLVPGNT